MTRTQALVAALIALLLAVAFLAGDRRRAEKDRVAAAGREYAIADSVSRALAPKLARVDTLVVRDTVKVRVAVARVTTIRDTVLSHLTDTVLVKEYVARTDTALRACSELAGDCAQFRSFALQRFAADSTKLVALRASIPTPPRVGFKTGVVAGAAGTLAVTHPETVAAIVRWIIHLVH